MATAWKWSNEERAQARFIVKQPMLNLKKAKFKVAVDGERLDWVVETLRAQCNPNDAAALVSWTIPTFPVGGMI